MSQLDRMVSAYERYFRMPEMTAYCCQDQTEQRMRWLLRQRGRIGREELAGVVLHVWQVAKDEAEANEIAEHFLTKLNE